MKPAEYARMRELEDWYWWFVAKREAAARSLSDSMGNLTGARILDAGCGTGAMLDVLRRWPTVDITGLDSSERALRFARARGHNTLVLGSLAQLPFGDRSFDAVTALDVIEHIDDDRLAVREVHRVLRPGGVLVATVPAYQLLWSRHDEALHHKRRYTRRAFTDLLTGAGLRVEFATYRLALLLPFAATTRLLRRRQPADRTSITESATAEAAVPAVPRSINRALVRLHSAEFRLARRLPLPFGLSVLAVARRPTENDAAIA